MSSALAVVEDKGTAALFRQATDVAGVCGAIVKQTARNIQGRKYVQVEGWQSIAVAYGCVASARDVERVTGGFRAIGEVRRASDGAVLATAEGFVGEDEPTWFGGLSNGKTLPKRPEYAIRAMAQTRAISRACRSAFAFVVTLIDASLSTTPAEEVPDGGFVEAQFTETKPAPASTPRVTTVSGSRPAVSSGGVNFPGYGRAKNQPVQGASEQDLKFYRQGAERSLADPSKSRWHDKERALIAAIDAELTRQSSATPPSNGDHNSIDAGSDPFSNVPPPGDEDAPF